VRFVIPTEPQAMRELPNINYMIYMRKCLLFVLTLTAVYGLSAQEPAQGWRWNFERGDALYKSEKFEEAYQEYRKVKDLREGMNTIDKCDLDYRLAMSAYRAENVAATELLVNWLDTYPDSARFPYALIALGNIYFENQSYSFAHACYLGVNPDALSAEERDEYNFKEGYCYFVAGDYDTLVPYMSAVSFKSEFYTHAQYCLGYAEYRKENYAAAKEHFFTIADSEAYSDVVPFYLMQIEFGAGNYHYVTENGARVLEMASGARATELTRMIGEAWFHLSSWQNATGYLAEYEKMGGDMNRVVCYMMGFSDYMMKDYEGAEQYLAKVPGPDDKLSQNASYHLGGIYLSLDDKPRAMQSFSIASTSGHDERISEDALFNYGKLQYELGGGYFNEAINVLNRYIDIYPSSNRIPQVREYLAAAYYNSRDYAAAYRAISQMPNPDNNVRAALQRITYSWAMEYYKEGDYASASRLLDESLRNRYNAKYVALAGYWQGAIFYKNAQYSEAIGKYEEFIRLSPKGESENIMARYDLGYAYFNEHNWDGAKVWFDDFLLEYTQEDSYRADALNRLGDVELSNRQFWRAIEFYDQAAELNTPEQYYSAFQRAMMLGMVERTDRKIESLGDIVSLGESPYISDAMYELGRTYIAEHRYSDASRTLAKFIDLYPTSPKYQPALLDLGLVSSNLGSNRDALAYYRMAVEHDKHSQYGRDAMNAIRGIYVEENNVDAYFAYAQDMGVETDLGASQRDSIAFVAAQRVYLSGDRTKAAAALNNYIKTYPEGAYVSGALYFSGENALGMGEKEVAYDYFTRLSDMYNNSYTEAGMERAASLAMELKHYDQAADTYNKLSEMATGAKRDAALAGYLKASSEISDAEEMGLVTVYVLARASDKAVIRSAKFARAKALTSLGMDAEAMPLFVELSGDVSGAEGAESAYRVIESEYGKGNTDKVTDLVYAFAAKNTPHTYWLGKSFLILGDIYAKAGDSFQARATYQSIVDGYSKTNDGIIDEAKARIAKLK
jgi:TolA-binding protein